MSEIVLYSDTQICRYCGTMYYNSKSHRCSDMFYAEGRQLAKDVLSKLDLANRISKLQVIGNE